MKICTKCKKLKVLSKFYNDKSKSCGKTSWCKMCYKEHGYGWDLYKKKYPWMKSYHNARQRCTNPNREHYKYYGAKGIKFLLTKEEIKTIWFRDEAYLMIKPSIDRKDSDGNYCYENCQFLELSKNTKKRHNNPRLLNWINKWKIYLPDEAVKKLCKILYIQDNYLK